MGRPPLFDKPMTGAERVRRSREMRRAGVKPEGLAALPKKEQAKLVGISERHWYTVGAYQRYRAFEWDGDILDGKYGRCGMSFIADVCKHGSPKAQRLIHDEILKNGAAAGRKLWQRAKGARRG